MVAVRDSGAVLVSKRELARLLSMSERSIDRLRDAGRLPRPILLAGKLLRWDRALIERWVAAGAPGID